MHVWPYLLKNLEWKGGEGQEIRKLNLELVPVFYWKQRYIWDETEDYK